MPDTMLKAILRPSFTKLRQHLTAGLREDLHGISREVHDLQREMVMRPLASTMKPVHAELLRVDETVDPNLPLAVSVYDYMWKFRDRPGPYSCTDEEGMLLNYAITSNYLKSGFEIATAFGFSSMYIGLAFKEVGGHLISMDCYVEEWAETDSYSPAQMASSLERVKAQVREGVPPYGLDMARKLSCLLDLTSVVDYEIGLSPESVPAAIGSRRIDFAFIDGGHHGEQPLSDFQAVAPYLLPKCAVFFHDNYSSNDAIGRAVREAERTLGTRAKMLATRNHLTLVGRGLDPSSVARMEKLTARR